MVFDLYRKNMINIQSDIDNAVKHLYNFEKKVVHKAIPAALTKTARMIGKPLRQQMSRELGIAQKHFKRRVKISKATWRRWESDIWVGTAVKIPVSKVFTSARTGMKYAKKSSNIAENELFQATMASGHTGIFYRKDSSKSSSGRDMKGRTRKGRLAIQEVMIDLSSSANRILPALGRKITKAHFPRLLAHEIRWRSNKLK